MSQEINELLAELSKRDKSSEDLILKAYHFALKAHEGYKRYSGDPYIVHPLGTAQNLAKMKADPKTVAAGLLHDTLSAKDSRATEEELKNNFDQDIVFLVQTVNELDIIKYRGLKRHAESLRKLLVATAKDIRVILIKLAERLHNIETLSFVPPEKQKRIALETIEIYAPLANRLGMGRVKGALEDGSFKYAYPQEYKKVIEISKSKREEALKHLEKIKNTLVKKLVAEGIKKFKTDFRVKHSYSLFKKLEYYNMDIEKIYDISALRILVPTIEDCYRVLGIIHNTWKPLPERLRDYIAVPKFNGYKSIHTVIFSGDGGIVEIQIRTFQMHEEAEFGVASHVFYDESGKPQSGGIVDKKLKWITQLIDWQKNVRASSDFINDLKTDFFKNRIFVFTPKGDVIELPEDASPIDFAYAIHSDIGNHAAGAKVNGKFVSFDTGLSNGDIVDIQTKEKSRPSRKWLEYAKTALARKHIRLSTTTTDKN